MILLDHGEKPKENTSRIGNMVEFFTFCSENSSALGDIQRRFAPSSSKLSLLESTVCTDVKAKGHCSVNQYRYVLCNQTKQGISDPSTNHPAIHFPYRLRYQCVNQTVVPVCEPNSILTGVFLLSFYGNLHCFFLFMFGSVYCLWKWNPYLANAMP